MNITYIIIWVSLLLFLKYDLKLSNIKTILRATLFTLITYVVIDLSYSEGLALSTDSPNTDIAEKFNKYKHKKQRCNYLRQQKQLSTANFNNEMQTLANTPPIGDNTFSASKTDADIAGLYNNQLGIVQAAFNDVLGVKSADSTSDYTCG